MRISLHDRHAIFSVRLPFREFDAITGTSWMPWGIIHIWPIGSVLNCSKSAFGPVVHHHGLPCASTTFGVSEPPAKVTGRLNRVSDRLALLFVVGTGFTVHLDCSSKRHQHSRFGLHLRSLLLEGLESGFAVALRAQLTKLLSNSFFGFFKRSKLAIETCATARAVTSPRLAMYAQ